MSIYGGPDIVTNDIALHLDAANSKSYPGTGTLWFNLASTTNGSLINGPAYSTNNRGIINFDGTDDRVDIAYDATNFVNTNFTWILWIKGIINNNAGMPVIGYGSGSWARLGFRYTSQWVFSQYGFTGTGNIDIGLGAWSPTDWIQLAISANYTGTNIRGYRNGALVSSVNNWRDSTGNAGNLGLGRAGSTSWPNALLIGSIGAFYVYRRALSASDILQNYKALKGRYGL